MVEYKRDGRLAPAYFSPNDKYLDQILQTVKNENTVLNLVFEIFFYKYQFHHWFLYFMQRVCHDFSLKIVLSHSTEKLRRWTLWCFKKLLVSKNFMDRRRGVPRFSVENFLSHSTEKFIRGTLWCFKKFQASKNFMDKRQNYDFLSTLFCPTVPKNLVGEHFCVSKCRKSWDLNPYLPPTASKPYRPTHCAMGTIEMEFLTNVSKTIKIFGTTETQKCTYYLKTLLS